MSMCVITLPSGNTYSFTPMMQYLHFSSANCWASSPHSLFCCNIPLFILSLFLLHPSFFSDHIVYAPCSPTVYHLLFFDASTYNPFCTLTSVVLLTIYYILSDSPYACFLIKVWMLIRLKDWGDQDTVIKKKPMRTLMLHIVFHGQLFLISLAQSLSALF